MAQVTLAIGEKTRWKASVLTSSTMAVTTKVSGRITKCLVLAYKLGLMAASIRANTKMIKNMGTESSLGPKTKSTPATGQMASNMALESIAKKAMENLNKGFGNMVKWSTGSKKTMM